MTFKYSNFRALKSVNPKSSGGSAPWTPAGALPLHPARGPKAAPWTPPKIGSRLRARYVRSAHMFAPPKKNRLALTRSLFALRAYVCPKKIGPQQFKKIGSRFALAMCATRKCLPPIINRCPLLAPPLFKSWFRHCPEPPPPFFHFATALWG